MEKIKISKIRHREEDRIQVLFRRDVTFISKIKNIKGRRWSKTKNCWHLPYSAESFDALKAVFDESQLDYERKKEPTAAKVINTQTKPTFLKYQNEGIGGRKVIGKQICIKKRNPLLLEAYVPFDKKGWVDVIRNIAGRHWDVKRTAWLLPNVKATYRHLKKYIGLENVVFDFKIEKDIPEEVEMPKVEKKIKATGYELLNENQKEAIKATEEQILLERFSPKTMKAYRYHLIGLFLFHKKMAPESITSKEVQEFLLYKIRSKKDFSESTQNQAINAYKAYAEKVLKQPQLFIDIQRPKKPQKLPNVLSTTEVVALINSIENIKHKLAMILIYSSGLRRSELINLLRKDVRIERRVMHVRGAKGKKDRYVVLAESAIPYLKRYLKIHSPVRWLYEGPMGGQYSVSSLQTIFRKAHAKSNIAPYATIHTLRHSYATHCVENGHNLKSVQDALGHSSLKTTEIYLHISSDALNKLKSPLDNLDLNH